MPGETSVSKIISEDVPPLFYLNIYTQCDTTTPVHTSFSREALDEILFPEKSISLNEYEKPDLSSPQWKQAAELYQQNRKVMGESLGKACEDLASMDACVCDGMGNGDDTVKDAVFNMVI